MRITIQLDDDLKSSVVAAEGNKLSATIGVVPSQPPPELLAAAKRLGAQSAGPASIPTLASDTSGGASKTRARLAKNERATQPRETKNSRTTGRGLSLSKKRRSRT